MKNIKQPFILIIDDEPSILHTLKNALEDENYRVETLAEGGKVLETIGILVPDVVLLDIFMPSYNGINLLESIKKEYPDQKVIMISGFGTIRIALEAIKKGAIDFIEKPLNLDEILTKLSFLKNEQLQPIFECNSLPTHNKEQVLDLVGSSALFFELMHHATLIAPLNLPILIYGPSGSGKTLLARYIHAQSTYSKYSFKIKQCATDSKFIEEMTSNCGTVFLKNIHELSSHMQQRILEYIEQENPPCRIIASSNQNLFKFSQEGRFNKSLFGRLSVTPLEITSITKRRYDIPLLADHFLQQANKNLNKNISLTTTALRFLRNYQWYGDVAQIKSFIQILIQSVCNSNAVLDIEDIKPLLPECPSAYLEEQEYTRFSSLQQATEIFQKHYLGHLLKRYRYDTLQLAEFLQIPITQLHAKMVELRLNQ